MKVYGYNHLNRSNLSSIHGSGSVWKARDAYNEEMSSIVLNFIHLPFVFSTACIFYKAFC